MGIGWFKLLFLLLLPQNLCVVLVPSSTFLFNSTLTLISTVLTIFQKFSFIISKFEVGKCQGQSTLPHDMVGNFQQYVEFYVHILYEPCLIQSEQNHFMISRTSLPCFLSQQCPSTFSLQHLDNFEDKFWNFWWHFSVTPWCSVSASQLVDWITSPRYEEMEFSVTEKTQQEISRCPNKCSIFYVGKCSMRALLQMWFCVALQSSRTAQFGPKGLKKEIKELVRDDLCEMHTTGPWGAVSSFPHSTIQVPWGSLPFLQSLSKTSTSDKPTPQMLSPHVRY